MKRCRPRKGTDSHERLSKAVSEALKEQAELPCKFYPALSWIEYIHYIKSYQSIWFDDEQCHQE